LIQAGRVTVNGRTVTELGTRADPQRDEIAVDGERLVRKGRFRRTVMLHKPRGVVSTLSDPERRPTVRDVLGEIDERLYPVGRLDLQTTGLLLLTNDGALAQGLMHPRRQVERVYHAKVDGTPDGRALARLRRGVRLDDGLVTPTRIRVVKALPTKTWIEIGVHEGRKHVVRRLFESIGHKVDKLERVRLGPLSLGTLPLGAWRDLTRTEVDALRAVAGLKPLGPPRGAAGAARGRPAPDTPPRKPRPTRGAPAPRGSRGARGEGPEATGRPRRPRPSRPRP
jgi:23S rRNA pseudouridine2605 synthase